MSFVRASNENGSSEDGRLVCARPRSRWASSGPKLEDADPSPLLVDERKVRTRSHEFEV